MDGSPGRRVETPAAGAEMSWGAVQSKVAQGCQRAQSEGETITEQL